MSGFTEVVESAMERYELQRVEDRKLHIANMAAQIVGHVLCSPGWQHEYTDRVAAFAVNVARQILAEVDKPTEAA